MKQKRAILALSIASIILVAPLLFSILRSSAAISTDSLIGYWKFEEASAAAIKVDSSGDNNDGAPSGTVLPQPSATGAPTNYSNVRSNTFGNTNNAVNISSVNAIDDMPVFTTSAWIRPSSYAGESLQGRIIDKTYSTDGWSFYVDNGALHFYANFSTSPLNKVTTAALPLNTWANVAISWDGTADANGVQMYIDGVLQTSFAVETSGSGSRVSDDTYNIIIGNNSALNRTFSGEIDEMRLYNRILADGELAEIGAGNHPTAVWTGASSSNYETAANWSTGAIPDPYARVQITDASNIATASANFALAGLTIDSDARFNLLDHNLTMNDGGAFNNLGTLQLRNSQTISGLNNDTDSGTILVTPLSDTTGLKVGNGFHDLIINDSTFAHWPFDEASGEIAQDISGFEKDADYQGTPVHDTDVAPTNFANDHSLTLNGTTDYVLFADQTIPENATWCAWVNIVAGDAVVLGGNNPDHYALAVFGGNEVRVHATDGQTASWVLASPIYGSWNNLCVTQTGATLALYLNGISQVGGGLLGVNGAGHISAIGTDSVTFFDGSIDDVRIYSRVLNGTEIGRVAAGNEPGLSLYRTTLTAPTNVEGDLVINSGIFDTSASNYGVSIAGNFDNNGGVYEGRNSTMVLDGDNQRINSSLSFYALTKQVSTAATLSFGRGSTTAINNMLTLNGVSGELLSLRSTTDNQAWHIDPAGDETISYLDVKDSNNINVSPIDITSTNTTDSGNNTNWTLNVDPDVPTSLGATSYVNGSFVGDSTPTLEFILNDSNVTDQLRYQVQIAITSDFSSPVVDYISDLGAQGARSFTVGENGSDDTYLSGSDGMTLPTADYYWRVKTIDGYISPNESSYTTANSGSIAFQLDVTPPSDPGVPATASVQSERRPTWAWTASTDAGVGIGSPTYTLQWSKDVSFVTGVASNTTDNLTFNHGSSLSDGYWYFRLRAVDTLGNTSGWATSSIHLIDTTGPTTPVAPYSASPTNYNQPTWSWSAPSDTGVGLATVPYTVQWSQTSNFSGGVSSDTVTTNNYVHASTIADGTWYFRVKAVDGLGNESAWSSNGMVLIDTSAPSLPGAPYADDPTNDNTPTWTWDPSIDMGVGLTGVPYMVQWSSSPSFSSVAGSTSATSATFTHGGALADGVWYIRINARDTLSNQSAYSDIGTVTIDTTAPDVPEAPTTTTPTNDNTPTWTWLEPNDAGVGLSDEPYEIEWSQDDDFETVTGSELLEDPTFTHTDDLAEGTWYFRVRATDITNNTSEYSLNGEVYIDLTPPTVPGDPSTADPVNNDVPTWTWLVSTDSGIGLDTPPYRVEWSMDNTFTGEVFSDVATSNEFTHTDGLEDGTWYFRVRAVDDVTNQSAWSSAGSKVVDFNPPTVPGTPTITTPTADNTPEWTWTASADAGVGLDEAPYMIEWSQDDDFLLSVETDTITPATFTHSIPLGDGTWYFRVRAVDDVGNISGYSPTGLVFVDATAPTVPGVPATGTPTIDDTPTWTWSASNDGAGTGLATNGYIVEWSTASDLSVDMQTSTSTTNSFTHLTSLADGTWYFRARAVDAVTNQSANSSVGSVEVDNTPPSVPGQPSTATPTNNNTPTWSWSVSTDNGVGMDNPAYELEWSLDNTFASSVYSDVANNDEFTHDDELADGTWYFRLKAHDTLDNTSTYSAVGSVLVSTAGPSVPGTPDTDNPTTDVTPTWTWTASTADSGLATPAYHLEWSQDEDFLSAVETDTSETNDFTHAQDLSDGTWYFRVRSEDNTGTFSPYSDVGSVLVDTTAPSVPGSAATSTPTNDRTPTWTWTASTDAGVGLSDEPYELQWSQTSDFSGGVSSDTSVSASFTHNDELADGTWYFRVRAVDELANTSSFAATESVVVDATAPSAPGEPDTSTPTNDRTPTWTWTASTDAGVGLDNPAYEIAWSLSASFGSGISTDTTNSTNFTHTTNLADGTWYFRVRAVDEVSNQSSWSAVGQVVVDGSVPSVPGTPTTGSSSTNDETPTWNWPVSTDSGIGLGTPAYQVQWSQDNTFNAGISNSTATAATFTHSSTLSEGTWYFRVRAVDGVMNTSGYSGVGSVYVDTDTPTSPGTPNTTPSPTNDRTPTWTWTASTDDGFGFGDEPYELQWSKDNNFVTDVQTGVAAEENFTHTTNLTDGSWHFRVRAIDDAGNQSSWSAHGSMVVDATAPTAPASLDTLTPTKNPTPTWTWTASTDAGVGLDNPAYEIAWSSTSDFTSNVINETVNNPTFTHDDELSIGMWYFRVRAADNLGNKTAWVTASVYLDHVPPVITNITATTGSTGVVISWTTDEIASTRVEYGSVDFDESTEEKDTDPRLSSHSVSITGLPSCSTFQFKVASIDQLDNEAISGAGLFTTTACSGNAAITGQVQASIGSDGGRTSLNTGSAALQLQVPGGVVSDVTDFQVKQLSPAPALLPIGQPSGRSLIGSHIYDLKAVNNERVLVTSFSDTLTISVTYTAAEAAGFTASSFGIFRHDGTAWQQLSGCIVNTTVRIVSCQTTAFSVFGLFGIRAIPTPPPPLPEGSGTVEPDPIPEIAPSRPDGQEEKGQTEAASESRGLSAAFTQVVRTVTKRPIWWASALLLVSAVVTLILLKKKRQSREKHVPYGVHRKD